MPGPQPRALQGNTFRVEIDGMPATAFSRVEIPTAELGVVSMRNGASLVPEPTIQPGSATYGRLVLQRPLSGTTELWDWWAEARAGTDVDRNVVVSLIDRARNPVWRWQFRNAFPVSYHSPVLDASGTDVVMESVALAFDSMDVDA
jgi:phage tail-like protein